MTPTTNDTGDDPARAGNAEVPAYRPNVLCLIADMSYREIICDLSDFLPIAIGALMTFSAEGNSHPTGLALHGQFAARGLAGESLPQGDGGHIPPRGDLQSRWLSRVG
jgi:hypothetical protein